MSTATLEKTTRRYIYGRDFITRKRIMNAARRNRRAMRRGEPPTVLMFRTGYGVEAVGLQIMEARNRWDGALVIEGQLNTGESFKGSFNPKIGAGPIDIAQR